VPRANLGHPHVHLPVAIGLERHEPPVARDRGRLLDPVEVGQHDEAGARKRVLRRADAWLELPDRQRGDQKRACATEEPGAPPPAAPRPDRPRLRRRASECVRIPVDVSVGSGALEGRERGQDLARVPRSRDGIELEHPADERFEGGFHRPCRQRVDGPVVFLDPLPELAAEHVAQDRCQRVDVGPFVLRCPPALLRRHVSRRPALDQRASEHVGHPEIEHLHLAVVAEEHVPGRQVPVDDALRVRVGEPLRDLDRDAQRLARAHRPSAQASCQGLPLEELQHEVRTVLCSPHVEERHDVGM